MYKVLVVDDEPLMREYLQQNIPLLCPHFSVTGTASDGLEAMEFLKKQAFHVVITDIKMPEMDGLKLADYINTNFPSVKTIIISGYSEFDYAKQAIRYNVRDYLLKPLIDNEIREVLQNIHESLLSEQQSLKAAPSDRNSLFASMINNPGEFYPSPEKANERYAVFSLSIAYLSMVLENFSLENIEQYQQEIFSLCIRYAENNEIPYYVYQHKLFFLLSGQAENELIYQAKELSNELLSLKGKYTFLKFITSLGYIVDSYAQIPLSYDTSIEGHVLSLCHNETPILPVSVKANQDFIKKLATICDLIFDDYISENNERIMSDLSAYTHLMDSPVNAASFLNFGTHLINEMELRGKIKKKYVKAAFSQLFLCVNRHIATADFKNANAALDYLFTLKALKTGHIDASESEQQTLIERTKEYIFLHYHEPLSLAAIADELSVSPNYLSSLFHKTMGEPYSKYIVRVRMEQALLVLKNNPNEKIYHVAEQTGFVSTKHFISVFKKFYGMSPTNYLAKLKSSL